MKINTEPINPKEIGQFDCDCGNDSFLVFFGKEEDTNEGTLVFVCSKCKVQLGGVGVEESSYLMLLDVARDSIKSQLKEVQNGDSN